MPLAWEPPRSSDDSQRVGVDRSYSYEEEDEDDDEYINPRIGPGRGDEESSEYAEGWRRAFAWPRVLLASFACLLAAVRIVIVSRRPTPFQQCHGDTPILVGTHHKTGTVLLKHIFLKEVCPMLGWRCSFDNVPTPCNSPAQARAAGLQLCFLQHGVRFKVQGSTEPYRFIHAIRDPLEVILSGYQYHLKTTEKWANRPDRRYNGTTYRKYLNSLPLREGLRAEAKHSMRDALKTMPRLLNRTAGPCTLVTRLEDFERDWAGTTAKIWDLIGVDRSTAYRLDRAVAKHNVYGSRPRYYNKHVEKNASSRGSMRQSLRHIDDAYANILRVRAKLGYPAHGREWQGDAA